MPNPSPSLQRYRDLLGSLGRPAVSALFPKDFEVYMMALEVVNSKGETLEYLSFPVLPEQFNKNEPELTNIKKTAGGLVSLTSPTFVPEEITLSGTFGRTFKVLVGREIIDFKAFSRSVDVVSAVKTAVKSFDAKIKTGYGCTKILQAICDLSTQVDETGVPNKLYFYNQALGEAHLVEKTNLSLRQNRDSSNQMWSYSLTLRTLAPANEITGTDPSSFKRLLQAGLQQRALSAITGPVGELLQDSFRKGADPVQQAAKNLGQATSEFLQNQADALREQANNFLR